ncbi:hypothetical protein PCL_00423 [Purpureocillium lilacinum]|uniref:Uncharacterized protein n=1 Tax=Purpureocillium lilacinum TaxID=33203 RepID=A0A2U3E727_PURLI|nr:hypothetical protein PCL_00423 [Purpureocillium lilacinum]
MSAPQTGARTPLDQPCWSDSVSTATTGRPRSQHPGRGPRATSVSSPAAPAFCVQLGAPRVTYSSHSIPKIKLVATRQTRAEMMDAEQHLCLKVPTHSARALGLNASAPMADGMAPPRLRLETKARGNFRPSYGSLLGATICSSTISTPGPDEARVHTSHTISQPYGRALIKDAHAPGSTGSATPVDGTIRLQPRHQVEGSPASKSTWSSPREGGEEDTPRISVALKMAAQLAQLATTLLQGSAHGWGRAFGNLRASLSETHVAGDWWNPNVSPAAASVVNSSPVSGTSEADHSGAPSPAGCYWALAMHK